tara:strand:+ start:788 stop:1006 length:219 start_codon:yes stop_codon:yes gene_type:complete
VLSKYISKEYHWVCNECGGKGCNDCHNGWGCNGPECEKCKRLGEPVNGQGKEIPLRGYNDRISTEEDSTGDG